MQRQWMLAVGVLFLNMSRILRHGLCQADEDVVLRKLDTRIVELRKMGKLPNQNLGDDWVCHWMPMVWVFLFFHFPYFWKHYVHIRFQFNSSYIQDISLCTLPHHPKSCSMFSLQVFVGWRLIQMIWNDLKWLLANHSHWLRWLRWVGSCDWYAWQSLHPRTKHSKERVVACHSETGAGMLPIWSGVDFFLWVF